MVAALQEAQLPAFLCTIYDANYPKPQGRIIRTAVTLFNDVITRAAFQRALLLIDLRLISDKPADYANPIEPSKIGGEKIAAAIMQAIQVPVPTTHSIVISSAW